MFIENEEENLTKSMDNNAVFYKNSQDQFHRLDGPALIFSCGTKYWYKNGNIHREEKPAVEYPNGTKYWYKEGKKHRLDGPAVEYCDGTKSWYIEGKSYSEIEYKYYLAGL